jgi:hydrogenase nickel incorporation protein HypB
MVMLSKADLLPVLDDFNPDRAETYLRNLASPAPLIHTSAKSGEGLETWLQWLRESVDEVRLAIKAAPQVQKHHHHHVHDPHHASEHS